MENPKYSVVVPVYRSAGTLDELCARLTKLFDTVLKESFEIILVNDASPDDSWEVITSLHQKNPKVKGINLSRNFGQHSATICGFAHARGDYVITLDDDLQHPPEEIPKMVQAMQENPQIDVVMGSFISKKHSLIRKLGTSLMNRLTSYISGKDPKLRLTSFRLMRAALVREVLQIQDQNPRLGYMILKLTKNITNVNVKHENRTVGKSGYSLGRLIKDLLNNVLNNSSLPLKLISVAGFASAIFSFVLGVYYIYRYLFVGVSVKGWTTLILLLLFFFGLTLFSVGIIGNYLIKILTGTKKYPQYVVRDILQ